MEDVGSWSLIPDFGYGSGNEIGPASSPSSSSDEGQPLYLPPPDLWRKKPSRYRCRLKGNISAAEKKEIRRAKNREAAQDLRDRKAAYENQLRLTATTLETDNAALQAEADRLFQHQQETRAKIHALQRGREPGVMASFPFLPTLDVPTTIDTDTVDTWLDCNHYPLIAPSEPVHLNLNLSNLLDNTEQNIDVGNTSSCLETTESAVLTPQQSGLQRLTAFLLIATMSWLVTWTITAVQLGQLQRKLPLVVPRCGLPPLWPLNFPLMAGPLSYLRQPLYSTLRLCPTTCWPRSRTMASMHPGFPSVVGVR